IASEAFTSFASTLKTLELDSNRLTHIPSGIFSGMRSLESLILSNNNLASIPDFLKIPVQNSLSDVFLDNNKINSSQNSLSRLTSLEKLTLYGNQLITIPSFSNAQGNLKELYLQQNKITSIVEADFDKLSLKKLHLGDNSITSLMPLLSLNRSLETLYFSGNNLASFSAEKMLEFLTKMSKVSVLDVSSTGLSSFPDASSLK
ncbi:hypothetical protein CAPTEDRAFT_54909, partial [Capitella teleta]